MERVGVQAWPSSDADLDCRIKRCVEVFAILAAKPDDNGADLRTSRSASTYRTVAPSGPQARQCARMIRPSCSDWRAAGQLYGREID